MREKKLRNQSDIGILNSICTNQAAWLVLVHYRGVGHDHVHHEALRKIVLLNTVVLFIEYTESHNNYFIVIVIITATADMKIMTKAHRYHCKSKLLHNGRALRIVSRTIVNSKLSRIKISPILYFLYRPPHVHVNTLVLAQHFHTHKYVTCASCPTPWGALSSTVNHHPFYFLFTHFVFTATSPIHSLLTIFATPCI